MKHKSMNIRSRVSMYFLLFTVIFITVLWLCQIVFIDRIYESIKSIELKSTARELTRLSGDDERMLSAAQLRSARSNMCIVIVKIAEGKKAEVVVSCEAARTCVIHNITPQSVINLYEMAKNDGGSVTNRFCLDLKTRTYVISEWSESENSDIESIVMALVTQKGSDEYLILLDSVITPLDATVRTLNILLAILSVIMVAVAFLLSSIVSRRIAKPISNINDTAKNLASGNYNVEFPSSSYREINELSDTLNIAAEELGRVDMLKKELISNTSHDLRTPLTMISGYAEIMRDLPGENTPENAQIIIDETKRLSSLVSDMLDISKLESGTQSVKFETFNLTSAIAETMERYTHFKESEGYNITFTYDRDVVVTTDRSKLLQAFCNLVNNAITYTGNDKRVDVEQLTYVAQDGTNRVRLSVHDTGDGIPEDKLGLIWERYYKIDSPHKRSAQGSGLGLSIVGKIMQLLDGECNVKSVLGEGSTFSIEIKF